MKRTWTRPCRFCGKLVVGAARNQRSHDDCRRRAKAQRHKIRHECRRAAAGLFPWDKKPLEEISIHRVPARPMTRGWYRWRVCCEPDCDRAFYAGPHAKRCEPCQRLRRRALGKLSRSRRRSTYVRGNIGVRAAHRGAAA